MNKIEKIDVAVIGGGISGLHVAWRLTDPEYRVAGQKRSVTVFEATAHLGGRLKSIEVPGVNFPLELGAMRFRSSHRLLDGLMKHLGSEVGQLDIQGVKYYLRGRREKTLRQLAYNAYLLPEEERKFASSPDKLILFAIRKALRSLEFPRLEDAEQQEITSRIERATTPKSMARLDWDIITTLGYLQLGPKAVPIRYVGFWNLLAHFLSNQAMRLIEDSFGYHSIIGNWNVSIALPWFIADFLDTKWFIPLDGFGSVVKSLSQRIRRNGGVIRTGSELIGIKQSSKWAGYDWELTFGKGKRKQVCVTKKVVLAMPKVALETLNIEAQNWPDIKESELQTVKPHNLLKILLVYEKAWWTSGYYPGGDVGRVVTDQPLRQIYYYGPEWIDNHTSSRLAEVQKSTWPFIMASYCDSYYTEFWSTFLSRSWRAGNDTYFNQPENWQSLNKENKDSLQRVAKQNGVHWRIVNKIHRQLAELHGRSIEELPKPVLGVIMNWDWEPYRGGWHTWEVDSAPVTVADYLLESIPGIHICGEAYSNQQGWVEGALKTAEQVLVSKFKLARPSWFTGKDFEDYLLRIVPPDTRRGKRSGT